MNNTKNIVIIGNGFDLMHDLNTDFRNFVNSSFNDYDKRILERIRREAIIFKAYILVNFNNQKTQGIEAITKQIKSVKNYIEQIQFGNDWYDLETILRDSMFFEYNNLDYEEYLSYDEILDDEKKSLPYDKIIDQWREKLRKYLKEQKNDKKYVKVNHILEKADSILTFNYTDTIEKNYGIPSEKINYFHGSIHENFVFGYSPFKVPRSGNRSLIGLYDNDQFEGVNLSSDFSNFNTKRSNKAHVNMISPMKSVQRFLLWAKRSKKYSNLSETKLIDIFFPDFNNFDAEYQFFLKSIDEAFMMKNPFKITDDVSEDPKGNILSLRGKLKKTNDKSLDALDDYFDDKQNLNIEKGDKGDLSIIGHDYESDGDIKRFITEAVGSTNINQIDYYYYLNDKDDGNVKEDNKRKNIRKSLSIQFGVKEDVINAKNLNQLKFIS